MGFFISLDFSWACVIAWNVSRAFCIALVFLLWELDAIEDSVDNCEILMWYFIGIIRCAFVHVNFIGRLILSIFPLAIVAS